MGCLGTSEVAVLGDGAAGPVHVRVDRVGAVSLRGGYFGWDHHGHTGIHDRETGDAARECGDNELVIGAGVEIVGKLVRTRARFGAKRLHR